MSHEIPQEKMDAICEAIYAGRKIEAIKLYREETGQGLKESKEFVEALAARLYEEAPDRFQVAPGKAGCSGVVLFLITIIGSVGWALFC